MAKYILGIDIGGTKIQAGLINNKNKVIKSQQFLLDNKNKKTVLNGILKSIDSVCTNEVKAIGIGITGLVDVQRGLVVESPNLPISWHAVSLKKIVQQRFKLPTSIDNDANCIGLAEAVIGVGKNYSTVLTITLGTGVGAGLVINKQVYHGALGAVEFGHMVIADSSPPCSCGRVGHLEALVSGLAMVRLYKKSTGLKKTSHQIVQEQKLKNQAAVQIIHNMAHWLSVGLANAIHCYNPDIIVLGGGLSKVKSLTQPAISMLKEKLIFPALNKTKIVTSKLGYNAGVIGAGLLTKNNKG